MNTGLSTGAADAAHARDLRGARRAHPPGRRALGVGARRLVEGDAEAREHPHGVGALGAASDDAGRDAAGAAGLRLLRVSGEVLPDHLPMPGRARTGRAGSRAPRPAAHRVGRRRAARPRPRGVRAARRDVPGGGRAGAADLDAGARPGGVVRARPRARAAPRGGRARVRQRVHHPQHALRVSAGHSGVGAASSTNGRRTRFGGSTWTR